MLAAGNCVTLVDAGDAIQGVAYGAVSEVKDISAIMNTMGYDVGTLGNYELDHGREHIFELAEQLENVAM